MKKYLIIFIIGLLFTSCSAPKNTITRGNKYANLYTEKPISIAIMPPINQTNFVDAKEYFYTTLYTPLCEKGYYVFSPYLTMEVFQNESAYDSEMFLEKDLGVFKKVLGADAVIFTIIKSWKKNTLGGAITVHIEYILRSTVTNETLYQREGVITVDTSVNSGGQFGMFSALIDLAATALTTALTEKVVAGRKCNVFVLSDMPTGVYDAMNYQKDQMLKAGEGMINAIVK